MKIWVGQEGHVEALAEAVRVDLQKERTWGNTPQNGYLLTSKQKHCFF